MSNRICGLAPTKEETDPVKLADRARRARQSIKVARVFHDVCCDHCGGRIERHQKVYRPFGEDTTPAYGPECYRELYPGEVAKLGQEYPRSCYHCKGTGQVHHWTGACYKCGDSHNPVDGSCKQRWGERLSDIEWPCRD